MIYVEVDPKNIVTRIRCNPDETLINSQKGFVLDYSEHTIPKPDYAEGKTPIQKADKTRGVWYEYVDADLAPTVFDDVKSLKAQVVEIQTYIVDQTYEELLNRGGM